MSDDRSEWTGLHALVLEELREVIDPELGMNVVDLGLVYGVQVNEGRVHVHLTLTTPACPLGEQMVRDAQERIGALEGVSEVQVDLVWEPVWSPSRMSAFAKESLGWNK